MFGIGLALDLIRRGLEPSKGLCRGYLASLDGKIAGDWATTDETNQHGIMMDTCNVDLPVPYSWNFADFTRRKKADPELLCVCLRVLISRTCL